MPAHIKLTVGRYDHTRRWEVVDLIAAVLQNIPEIETGTPLQAGEVCVIVQLRYPEVPR